MYDFSWLLKNTTVDMDIGSDVYDQLVFREPHSIYNAKAPVFWFSWALATFCTVIASLEYRTRVLQYKKSMTAWGGTITIRTLISAYIDNDDPWFVIQKYTAQSFWFLGAMQLHYGAAFTSMMVVFGLESLLDSMRVVIAYHESQSLKDYIPTSDHFVKVKNRSSIELQPTNVYEDLTRPPMIALMVFVTQVLLLSFVLTDLKHTPTYTCLDGTTGCPVVGTLGSYVFYLLGIFLALVFMLGPKTNYGSSEQNTSFWLRILLTTQQTGAHVSWNDPKRGKRMHYSLVHNSWRLWIRFIMSTIVNGIGFHVLIHSLPIQISSQGGFTMVVCRSVGMMSLVDLDDTIGYTLTLAHSGEETVTAQDSSAVPVDDDVDIAIKKVIEDAKMKLDALVRKNKNI
jgi:hypothetical protein